MKRKYLALLLGLGLIGGILPGCQYVSEETEVVESENTRATLSKKDKKGIDDTIADATSELTIHGVSAFSWDERCFIVVDMEYRNRSDISEQELNVQYFYCFVDNEEADHILYSDLTVSEIGKLSWNPLDDFLNTRLLFQDTVVQPERTERGYLIYEYYRPFAELEVQLGSLRIFVDPDDITVLTVPDHKDPEETVPEETEESVPSEETEAPTETTVETTVPPTEAPTEPPTETPAETSAPEETAAETEAPAETSA